MTRTGEEFGGIIRAIKDAEGTSYRGLERRMQERIGERVTAMYMTSAAAGMVTDPSEREIRKLASAFPDFASRLWAVIGRQEPQTIPDDVVRRLDAAAKAQGTSREIILRRAVDLYLSAAGASS